MPELLYFTAIGATAVIALVANLGRFRRTQTLTRRAASVHAELEAWAADTDWRISDGTDVARVDRADHITGLAGFPRDWDLAVGKDKRNKDYENYAPIRKWVYGTVLERETALGRITIIGCWREESATYNVFASLSGAPHTSPFTVDLLDHGELVNDGTPPHGLSEDHVHGALAQLTAPARLRILGGVVVLHSAAWLSPEVAEDRARRLLELGRSLPHGPALGPER